ncbi:MAG: twin-arginine translocase TatA/TatE family subunit [Treponema sp.]|nr:twin-arginine translocase TatA/TatE family subunit [Treponema sp.]
MKIGGAELVVIILVALFVIGPDKLPIYAKKLGKALSSLRDPRTFWQRKSAKTSRNLCRIS